MDNETNAQSRAFYQNLGKLFYAVVAIDGDVNEVEIKELKKIIQTKWSTFDNSFAIVNVFNWLNEDQEYNAEMCYKSFIMFKNENEKLFTDQVKALILSTANKIASSFARKNKSELILLAKLNMALTK